MLLNERMNASCVDGEEASNEKHSLQTRRNEYRRGHGILDKKCGLLYFYLRIKRLSNEETHKPRHFLNYDKPRMNTQNAL